MRGEEGRGGEGGEGGEGGGTLLLKRSFLFVLVMLCNEKRPNKRLLPFKLKLCYMYV